MLCAFLLPLHTQYLAYIPELRGEAWQYGRLGIFAVDIAIMGLLCACIIAGSSISKSAKNRIILLALFVGVLLVSTLHHGGDSGSWFMVLRFIEGLLFVWAIVATNLSLAKLLWAFIGGVSLSALFGIWQFAVQYVPESALFGVAEQVSWRQGASIVMSETGRFLRSYGLSPHPNIFGGYVAMALIALVWVLLRNIKKNEAHSSRFMRTAFGQLWMFPLLILALALLFSFSRNAWLAFACALASLLIISLRFGARLVKDFWVKILLAFFLFSAVMTWAIFPILQTRLLAQEAHEVVSVEDRMQGYRDALAIVKTDWWRGIGLTRFTYHVAETIDPDRELWRVFPVHNVFLLLAAEGSVFSLLAFLLMLFFLFQDGTRQLAHATIRDRLPRGSLSIIMVVPLVVLGFFDSYLVTLPTGLFLLMFSIGISIKSLEISPERK